MPTEQFLNSLIINKVDTKSTFDAMKAAGKINPDELYLVEEEPIDSVPTEGSNNPVTSGGVKTYVDNKVDSKVSKSGDTMTGPLTLSEAPTEDNHAATKAYVDDSVGALIEASTTDLTAGTSALTTGKMYLVYE